MGRRRVYRSNARQAVALLFVPDEISLQTAGTMAIATNTFSPMSSGTSPLGHGQFTGDPGYGVNRFAGETMPLQQWYSLIKPVSDPQNVAVGTGAGVSGQPGMPSTGLGNGLLGPGPGPGME